ncbi:MAG: DUF3644 domain-containing protein [Thermoanaerobaculia bacterium]
MKWGAEHYYRGKGVEYRYYRQGAKRRSFDRTKHGAFKHWELERCLNCDDSPIDCNTANNLRFLTGLRHEVEHQGTRGLDDFLSGRYQACALNFSYYITKLFGARWSLDRQLPFSIQFLHLTPDQLDARPAIPVLPARLRSFIADFDAGLSHDEYNNERFSYRLLFKKKLVNRPGQADRVIEFIDPDSDLAKQIDKEYWVKKEVERPKFMAKNVVAAIRKAGFTKFRVQPDHLAMWQAEDAKNSAKGYGTLVEGTWLWYQSWIDRCIELCAAAGDKYREKNSAA